MEVILRSDVEKLGLKGEVVDVKSGYARNYLLPRKLAEVATPGRVAEIRRIDEERARHEARSAEQAAGIADTLTKTVLRFEVKAGPTGSDVVLMTVPCRQPAQLTALKPVQLLRFELVAVQIPPLVYLSM